MFRLYIRIPTHTELLLTRIFVTELLKYHQKHVFAHEKNAVEMLMTTSKFENTEIFLGKS